MPSPGFRSTVHAGNDQDQHGPGNENLGEPRKGTVFKEVERFRPGKPHQSPMTIGETVFPAYGGWL